jgi:hypothetical protein
MPPNHLRPLDLLESAEQDDRATAENECNSGRCYIEFLRLGVAIQLTSVDPAPTHTARTLATVARPGRLSGSISGIPADERARYPHDRRTCFDLREDVPSAANVRSAACAPIKLYAEIEG